MPYLLMATGFALAGGFIGRSKGSSFWLWFVVAGVAPIAGLLAAILYRVERDELRRQCPRCGRVRMLYDAVCTHCGQELEFPETAIAPESSEPRAVAHS